MDVSVCNFYETVRNEKQHEWSKAKQSKEKKWNKKDRRRKN